ncbi:MAG TPA: hypothetical protein VL096_13945 [Pirellulaceae bacterium]|nr:hypothetical protein [Pirellulaceae bacterium]
MKHRWQNSLLTAAPIAFAIWFFYMAYLGLTWLETGENVASVDWLPARATNVSFYRSYGSTAYEFDIPEKDFVAWSDWDVAEIVEPVSMMRYSYFAEPSPHLSVNATTEEEVVAHEKAISERYATIADGLYYGHLRSNGGGVWVAYDRRTGRAFFRSAPR